MMIVSKYAFTWSVSEHLLKYNGINELNCEKMNHLKIRSYIMNII